LAESHTTGSAPCRGHGISPGAEQADHSARRTFRTSAAPVSSRFVQDGESLITHH